MPKIGNSGERLLKHIQRVEQPVPVLLDHDRVTMTLNMHHEHRGEEPFGLSIISQQLLEFMEEPYRRRITVTEEWQAVEAPFPSDRIGFIVVENNEGKDPLVHPSPEEKAKIAARIVEASYTKVSSEADLILPGWGIPKRPNGGTLYIRCQKGTANCRVYILSR